MKFIELTVDLEAFDPKNGVPQSRCGALAAHIWPAGSLCLERLLDLALGVSFWVRLIENRSRYAESRISYDRSYGFHGEPGRDQLADAPPQSLAARFVAFAGLTSLTI